MVVPPDDINAAPFTTSVANAAVAFHAAAMRQLDGGAEEVLTSTNHEIVGGREWEGSAWVNEYVRPARIEHLLGSVRKIGLTACHGCGFMRAARDRPFDEEDREVLHLVMLGVGRFFDAGAPRVLLPPRARDTFDVLLSGATDKEIAVRLGISPHTVRQYVKAIFKAYGVSSRAQLIARAATRGPDTGAGLARAQRRRALPAAERAREGAQLRGG